MIDNRISPEEIKQKIELIHKTFEELQNLRVRSKEELSTIDKELSNHYHNIEGTEINYMTDSHIMMVELKKILDIRRDAKIKHTLLESFVTALERSIGKTKNRYLEIIKKHAEVIQEIIDRSKN